MTSMTRADRRIFRPWRHAAAACHAERSRGANVIDADSAEKRRAVLRVESYDVTATPFQQLGAGAVPAVALMH